MSLFRADGCHTASVRTTTPAQLLQMSRGDLDALLHRHPRLAYGLARLLTNRLEESENLTIIDLREKNRQLTIAYRQLQEAQAQLVEKERLERELEIAHQIQVSVLPPALPALAGFQIGARIMPARAVGGDFYDVIPLGAQRLGIVVGDVCDKGIPAALFMMRAYSLLRAKARRTGTPAQVLRAVNAHLVSRNPSGMFVTLLYGVLDLASARFEYARAGHPQPIVLDGAARPCAPIARSGQPLGLWDKPALDEQVVSIAPGGAVIVFSDGLSDVLDDSPDERRLDSLCSRLAAGADVSAQQVCDGLWQQVVDSSMSQQRDDFVAVAVKRARA
jgi:serine phosphatase RsbU (regulator of sigma subunit)